MNAIADPCIACLKERPGAAMRLLCFPHAGGSLLTYARWVRAFEHLAPMVELWSMQLAPGPFDAFTSVVERLADVAAATFESDASRRAHAPKRMVFFGHSLGGLLAYGTARVLGARAAAFPDALIVASTTAPQAERPNSGAAPATWTREDRRSYLRALGGVEDDVLEDPSRLDEIAAEVAHELELRRSFRYVPEPPFAFPMVAYGGADENIARELLAWSELSGADFTLRLWPGGHFFLHEPATRERVVRALVSDLARWL